jgi:GAF domain-containing protein
MLSSKSILRRRSGGRHHLCWSRATLAGGDGHRGHRSAAGSARSSIARVFRRDVDKVLEVDRLRQLIALGPALVGELDLDVLLNRLLETACSVTACRYAAIGILDRSRSELERFITLGLSDDQVRAIGHLPRGRGVLGVLIHDPRPFRLTEVSVHPHSSGFPPGHPQMHSFLGVPILIRGRAWGNLYLTDKRIGEFTEADEYAATTLATWAAIAVDHSRLLAGALERQGEREPEAADKEKIEYGSS